MGESDRVFTVFTKEFGKLDMWAISERKIISKLRGGLETLYCSEIEFVQGRNRKTLTDTFLLSSHRAIRSDLTRMRIALRMLETLDMFLKGEICDPKIWNIVYDSLEVLNAEDFPSQRYSLVYYYFFWNLVSTLGWRPHLKMYGLEIANFLGTLIGGNAEFLFSSALEKSAPSHLHEISRRYFIEIKKEIQ